MKIIREVKIGIISIISLAILIWGLSYLKGLNIFKTADEYIAVFNNVEGIIESSAVYINGYRVGSVNMVGFDPENPENIVVHISIEEKVKLPLKSYTQAISTNPIASAKDISLILYDTNAYHQPGDTILSYLPVGLSESIKTISSGVETTLASLNLMLQKLNNIFNKETSSNIQNTISNVSSLTSEDGDLAVSINNLKKFSGALTQKTEELKNSIQNMSEFSDSLSQLKLNSIAASLGRTLSSIDTIMMKIKSGEGSAGMLINNDSLYSNLNAATESLDLLLTDLKENPKRYVHFSVFGKKDK